jgi:hypothetical protein
MFWRVGPTFFRKQSQQQNNNEFSFTQQKQLWQRALALHATKFVANVG